jgi:murein DD-endopeptidase MepM/ murein hydrolase activator NlpD
MLRIVRFNERATRCAAGSRGLTLLVVALAAGGCSAGFDRLGLAPMNYNGGPPSTGATPPIPREPMRHSQAPLPPQGEYRPDDRLDYRQDYRPEYRPDRRSDGQGSFSRDGDRSALPQGRDTTVRMAGLPEPYDRAQPYERAPQQRTTPPPAPYDAGRAPSRPIPPAPPAQASYEPPGHRAQPQGNMIEVRPGDTLYGLSKTHRVPISELMRINNLAGPQLRVGQQLMLPADRRRRVASLPQARAPGYEPPTAPAPAYEPPTAYVPPPPYVPPTPARSATPTRAPEPILPHHRDTGPIVPPLVETPPTAAAPASRGDTSGWTGTYTVERGDSLYAIARKHGVKLHLLERVNEIANPRKVMPGTVLKVPKPGDTPPVARNTPTPPTPPMAKTAPPISPPSVATREPMASSGVPPVQPTIINRRGPAPAAEHQRVASLGQGTTDASPPDAPEPPAQAIDAPPRAAALPTPSKVAAPPGKFRWPARGKIIAGFGKQPGGGPNDGINISVPRGTDVHAAESGVVTYAGDEVQGYGNLVIVRHPEGWITAYAHNESLMVKSGENVRRGQIIAKAGNTGTVSQPQLHFQIRHGPSATPVDPTPHLER